jgi:hypothetical protein
MSKSNFVLQNSLTEFKFRGNEWTILNYCIYKCDG